jgi:hypothetical protein
VIESGFRVWGIDSSPSMIDACRERFSNAAWVVAGMRELALGRRFDGVLAWDSFFHLQMSHQRAMFARLAAHALPGASLMFTGGRVEGEAIGSYCGAPLYHASLDPAEYEQLLTSSGFSVGAYKADDPEFGGTQCGLPRTTWVEPSGDYGEARYSLSLRRESRAWAGSALVAGADVSGARIDESRPGSPPARSGFPQTIIRNQDDFLQAEITRRSARTGATAVVMRICGSIVWRPVCCFVGRERRFISGLPPCGHVHVAFCSSPSPLVVDGIARGAGDLDCVRPCTGT